MKDARNKLNQEDDVNANSSKYASLTAGLLARKGEAVPAAAAFTAEAIAQHIPTRRLAQEADRVLAERNPASHNLMNESPGAQVVADHQDMIEQAFNERAMAMSEGDVLGLGDQSLHKSDSQPVLDARGMSLSNRRELNLPELGESVTGISPDAQNEGGAAASNWDDDNGNWFENIVSNAISEAGRQVNETNESGHDIDRARPVAPEFPGPAKSDDHSGDSNPVTSVPTQVTASSGGCGDKAEKVREAIKSGKTALATRSAMRLDPRRFIRLSLAAQKLELSSQEVMVAALDTYLDALDEEVFNDCACMKKGLI